MKTFRILFPCLLAIFNLQSSVCKGQGNCAASSMNYSGLDQLPDSASGSGLTNCQNTAATVASNVVWFVAPIHATKPFRLLSVNSIQDVLAGGIFLYTSTNNIPITNAAGGATNQLWVNNGSNNLASNDVVVIWYQSSGNYQRCLVTNSSTSQLGLWPNAANPTAVGDLVFKMTQNGTFPCGTAATNFSSTAGLYFGRKGTPTLLEMNYSNAAFLRAVTGDYR